jgi:hypothetical protein
VSPGAKFCDVTVTSLLLPPSAGLQLQVWTKGGPILSVIPQDLCHLTSRMSARIGVRHLVTQWSADPCSWFFLGHLLTATEVIPARNDRKATGGMEFFFSLSRGGVDGESRKREREREREQRRMSDSLSLVTSDAVQPSCGILSEGDKRDSEGDMLGLLPFSTCAT